MRNKLDDIILLVGALTVILFGTLFGLVLR